MKKLFLALATLTLAVALMSCGGEKLADTTWKGSDNYWNYTLTFTKDEVTFNQTDKDTQNPVKPTEMTEKYTIKGDTVYIISSYNGEKNPFCTINENTITVAADGQTIKFAKQE